MRRADKAVAKLERPHAYAQVGFAKIAGMAAAQTFTEYNDGENQEPNWHRDFYNGIFNPGTSHIYKVNYNFSTGRVGMSVDGAAMALTPWSPDSEWHSGWYGEFFGETVDRGDDVPGTATNKTLFRYLTTKICRGCSFARAEVAGVRQDLPVYKLQWITGSDETSFYVWTER